MRPILSLAFASALTLGGLGLLGWQAFGPAPWWVFGRMIGVGLFFTALGGVWLWSDFVSPKRNHEAEVSRPATAYLPGLANGNPHVLFVAALTAFFICCFALTAWKQVPLGMAFMGIIAVSFASWLLQLVKKKA